MVHTYSLNIRNFHYQDSWCFGPSVQRVFEATWWPAGSSIPTPVKTVGMNVSLVRSGMSHTLATFSIQVRFLKLSWNLKNLAEIWRTLQQHMLAWQFIKKNIAWLCSETHKNRVCWVFDWRVGCTKISKSCRNSNLTWCKLYLCERRPKMQKKWFLGHFPRRATIL